MSAFVIYPRPSVRFTMASEAVTGGKDAMETGFALSQIDTTTPHPARMYDALLGGKDNYTADRNAVRQLLKAGEAGITQIIDVGTGIPASGNDFGQPIALLLVAILHFITGRENPARILAVFREALPAGSYLALSHATGDFRPAAARQAAAVYDHATSSVTLRTRAQVAALFQGWDLVEPGLVQVPLRRPDGKPPRPREPPSPVP